MTTTPPCQFCGTPGRWLDHRTAACESCGATKVNQSPDPARTLIGLQAAAGIKPNAVANPLAPAGRAESLLEWRRRCWQVVRTLAETGERFTTADVLNRMGPAPTGNSAVLIDGLLMTAAYDHRKLNHLPTGEWVSV